MIDPMIICDLAFWSLLSFRFDHSEVLLSFTPRSFSYFITFYWIKYYAVRTEIEPALPNLLERTISLSLPRPISRHLQRMHFCLSGRLIIIANREWVETNTDQQRRPPQSKDATIHPSPIILSSTTNTNKKRGLIFIIFEIFIVYEGESWKKDPVANNSRGPTLAVCSVVSELLRSVQIPVTPTFLSAGKYIGWKIPPIVGLTCKSKTRIPSMVRTYIGPWIDLYPIPYSHIQTFLSLIGFFEYCIL